MKNKHRMSPMIYLLIYMVVALVVSYLLPIYYLGRTFLILGAILIFIGLAINLWADSLFKKYHTTVKPDETPAMLVIEGPYRYSRNPMYLGFVVLLLGIAMVLNTVSAFIAPVLMFITLEIKFISAEEDTMKRSFGDKYTDYCSRVRRWI